ncbi:MAG: glycosyltransferase family 4 protein [Candidatus Eisenbacteria bacterium]
MRRILGFSSVPLDESVGAGAARIANLYRWLPADRYDRTLVTLAGLRGSGGESPLPGGGRVIRLPSPVQTLYFYLEKARLLPFFRVAAAHRRFPLGAAKWLREEADLVQFDSLWLTPWADRLPPGVPVVYGSHNFETEWYEGELRRYLFRRRHARFLTGLERRAVLRADRVLAVTEEDKTKFAERFGADPAKIRVVPNGFDEDRFRPAGPDERGEARRALGLPGDRRIALFAGSDVAPNREGVDSILRSIAPRTPPDVLFVVAGSVGRSYGGKVVKDRVIFTGPVKDIASWFRAADVGLNPIRLGSGSNIKVLQYLGAGLAVISTEFGMRGFDDLRAHVKIARIDRFHYHIDKIEPDPAAAEKARGSYGWRRASATLSAVYADLLGEANPGGESP